MFTIRSAARGIAVCLAVLVSQAMAQDAPSNYMAGFRYNAFGWLTGEISPDPDGSGPRSFAATRNTYLNGRLVKVEAGELSSWQSEVVAPASWTGFAILKTVDFEHDAFDRKTKESLSASGTTYAVTQYSYDALGRLECTAIRMNQAAFSSLPSSACSLGPVGAQGPDRITKNVYDPAGQLLQVRKAVGTCQIPGGQCLEQAYVTYTYTPSGKTEAVIDANGNHAVLAYDGYDRLTTWFFPSIVRPPAFDPATPSTAYSSAGSPDGANYEQYGYDANGNRTSLRKRDGSTITYQYDALNRMTVKIVPARAGLAQTHTRDVYYTYDLRGLMTGARFDNLSGEGITTAYDGFGRVSSSALGMDGISRQLGSLYDANGNRVRLTFPDSAFVTYAYDGLDRPRSVTGNSSDWSREFTYDASGNLTAAVVGLAGSTTFGRDPVGRLSSLSRDIAGGSSLDDSATFGFNTASQIIQAQRSNDAYAFTARGNVTRPYAVNGLNQYTSVSGSGYCYDPNGNLTADGQFVYLYDVENRLVEKRDQTGAQCNALGYTGNLRAALRYDPMGRLYETIGSVTGTTRLLIDGDALVAEYDGGGILQRRYLHGADGKADDPVAWYEGPVMTNATLRHQYSDHQGSIVLTADAAGGSARIFKFDEYGFPQSASSTQLTPENGARFLYTGQAWLPDLGMSYYKARMYSPVLGRFMQTDPIGYDDQKNLYAYVGNDPINHTDPSGQAIDTIVDIGFLVYDAYKILTEGATTENVAATGADAAAVFVPFATGGGLVVRGTAKAAADSAKVANKTQDMARANLLPKPPTGPGSAPRSERDPQRTWSAAERSAKREQQGGQCANGCGTKIDASNSNGHHVRRHADGGRTNTANHAEVCTDCHKKLHSAGVE